jgi:hypothetical protein
MAKYMIVTRDWKGSYDEKMPKGWKLFGQEDDIQTGQDCYAMIFYKGKPKQKKTPQEIYNIYESLFSEDVKGFSNDVDSEGFREDKIIIEK